MDLLSNTGNYSQYLVIAYNGKKSEKEQIYIYIRGLKTPPLDHAKHIHF